MHPSTQRFLTAARALGLEPELVSYEQSTRTAEQAAEAVGCDVSQIVKSLCFVVDGQPIMALVSGHNRLDEKKLASHFAVGRKKVKRADADIVKASTGYSIGGVAPLGHPITMPILVDEELMGHDAVWAAAGTPYAVFPIAPQTLAEVVGGVVIDLKKE